MKNELQTTQEIQTAFDQVIAGDTATGIKYADIFRLTVQTHGSNAEAIRVELQAVIDRNYNSDVISSRPERRDSYRNFKRAAASDRVTKYLPESNTGGLFITFDTVDKVSTVTVTYKSIEKMEADNKQAARVASKEVADAKHEQEQREAQALIMRTSATAADILKLITGYLPEITTLTMADVFAEYEKQVKLKAESDQQKRDLQKQTATDNADKRKQAADKRKQKEAAWAALAEAEAGRSQAAKDSQKDIDARTQAKA